MSFHIATEKYEKSIKHAEKGLEIFRLIRDLQSEKSCLAIIGEAYRCLGRVRKAVAFQNKAPQITQRIGDKRGEARCLNNLGKSCHFLGCIMTSPLPTIGKRLKSVKQSECAEKKVYRAIRGINRVL